MSWQFYNPNPESKFVGDWNVDYSYARGRDSRGRYSGHNNNDDVIDRLTGMMRSARTEEERENYRKMIEQLNR